MGLATRGLHAVGCVFQGFGFLVERFGLLLETGCLGFVALASATSAFSSARSAWASAVPDAASSHFALGLHGIVALFADFLGRTITCGKRKKDGDERLQMRYSS